MVSSPRAEVEDFLYDKLAKFGFNDKLRREVAEELSVELAVNFEITWERW